MSWIDTLAVLLIAFHLVGGYQAGLVRSLFSLLGLAVALVAVLFGAPWLAAMLVPGPPTWQAWLTLALALLLPLIVGRLLREGFARLEPRLHVERWRHANRWLGLLPGALWGGLGALVLTWLYASFVAPLPASSVVSSRLLDAGGAPLEQAVSAAQKGFPKILVTEEGWEVLPVQAQTAPAVSPTKLEQDMLAQVNQERRKRGLAPLRWDGELAAVARAHSRDMLARSYFAHEDPEGKSAADRAARAGVSYLMLGENLAFAPNLRIAHQGLMKSPGHRENLLRPQFRRLGIGIVRIPANARYHPRGQRVPTGRYGGYLIATQVFAK